MVSNNIKYLHPINRLYKKHGAEEVTVAEKFARFFGTTKYLFWQTIIVSAWIIINIVAINLRWDAYPFILLNLVFSTQAAYAAPLILLAQNKQENRDKVAAQREIDKAEIDYSHNLETLAINRLVASSLNITKKDIEDMSSTILSNNLDIKNINN